MKYEYTPTGVCSTKFIFEIEDDIIKDFIAIGGCDGNLKGISALIKNKSVDDTISALKGINCRNRGTSCPDQISLALLSYKNHK
ncbi:MAG: TIGR03905 family TSCPD domain-containing protein [Mycoplasmataceae bacterium]|jgi:uncharacterized protein (TIGR03905 family)|nr:TIGR03905 family TSCPD domain-containing protein [Mycoplasmataceae bacterium]